MNWQWSSFEELKLNELYDILALRQQIFILEQNCIYADLDYLDQPAQHLLGRDNNQLVAYSRLLPLGIPYKGAISFGRVLVAKEARGRNIGKNMIHEVFSYLKKQNNAHPIIISAQLYLKTFYESFGFIAEGESYDDDGIPHIKM